MICGGASYRKSDGTTRVYTLNCETMEFTEKAKMPKKMRGHCCNLIRGQVHIFRDEDYLVYDISENTWTEKQMDVISVG